MDKRLLSIPTPFFLMDQEAISKEVDNIKKAFEKHWSNYEIGYSVKTNSFPPLAKYLQEQGVSAEVVSFDEYQLVKSIGFENNSIICNGPIKESQWLTKILENKIKFNIDSNYEVDFILEQINNSSTEAVECGIRVNLDIESVFLDEINTDNFGSRFGFSYENGSLELVIQKLRSVGNIKIVGLHFHVNSNTRSLAIYSWLTHKFIEITRKYNLKDIQYFDIGGGFYGGVPSKPQWGDYISTIGNILSQNKFNSKRLKLIIEPGVSLLASSMKYYTKVKDIRRNSRVDIGLLDGSRIHIDPFFHKTRNQYFYSVIKTEQSDRGLINVQLTGYTCLEKDRFFIDSKNFISKGDIIEFCKVGAYTLTLSPLFISYFPAVYSFNEENKLECLRAKWTYKEFLQKSKI